MNWGIDTSIPEGCAQFKEEWDKLAEMAPEIIKKDYIVFPHEKKPVLSSEPHFRSVWKHYRNHYFKLTITKMV